MTKTLGRAPRTVLELGPSDSLVGALVATASGVERIHIVDVGDFASVDVSIYKGLIESIDQTTPGFAKRVQLSSRAALLHSISATYHTEGLKDLAKVPHGSVELTFSLKVLEHVRRHEFKTLFHLLARACASPSVQRHIVDLHDHLGCRLNNLRFNEEF